ncbi:MAG TPA: cytochrome c oxidase accessory protein CcoG [Pseudomonadales bacterium]|nr:cytochrome c oxidase accessory protein CcoG [Pseudomonadales bacterium]
MSDKIPLQDISDMAPAEVCEVDLYQKREKIYTRKIEGFFQRIRLLTGWPLLAGYFLLPWLNWGDRQSVLFDLPARQFHILGLTFWPQDMSLLAWVLIIAAWSLFFITVWAGRVWCGYTCPQTVWTSMFMWAEQFAEGTRNQRIKLDNAPISFNKIWRKSFKQAMWLGIAFVTGVTFIGYFYPIRSLIPDLMSLEVNHWAAAFILFFTVATYINAGYLREQVCIYMCPYARFQSVMFDADTLIVSYNPERGEPRGARKRHETKPDTLGDCIDCDLCVQVCPTGIDIRNGLQIECITCALCIDACNSVMDKMGYDKGLISYTSENALKGKKTHWFRPRLVGYGVAILVMIIAFGIRIYTRIPLEVDVTRDRNTLFSTNSMGLIENTYTLKIINMDNQTHLFEVKATGIEALSMIGRETINAAPGEIVELPLRLVADPAFLKKTSTTIEFIVSSTDGQLSHTTESRFLGPRTM